MVKHPKRPRDPNQLAKLIVDISTGEAEDKSETQGKNPAAVALGKLGGHRGGKSRMDALSPEERKVLGLKAAIARWSKRKATTT